MENLKYTELLQLNKILQKNTAGHINDVGILSNVTVNLFKEVLEYNCRINGINPFIELGNFDNIVQDSANFKNKNTVIVFYDTLNIVDSVSVFFEDLTDEMYLNLKQKLFSELDVIFNNLKSVSSLIFNTFSSSYFTNNTLTKTKIEKFVDELNQYLFTIKTLNVTLINIDKIYTKIGLKEAIDFRFYNSSKAPYSFTFFKHYSKCILPVFFKTTGKLKKAIIFDCDNTLWKGIIGEDGIEGIDLDATSSYGRYFNTVQQIAVYLNKMGIIVGICSKNNEQDVVDVFRNHKDMILKEEHIVVKKINWTDKVTNLKEIAQELNIGLDSIVFVDDSDFEINFIKNQLPEVLTFHVPKKISEYVNTLLDIVYSNFSLVPTADDLKKTEMYKQQFERENSKNNFLQIEDYLASLQIELKILKNDIEFISRLSQLTQKTNQFNLTTRRYTENDISQFINDPTKFVYAMFVKDKFGDSGLTGVCIAFQDEKNSTHVILDSLLMSCRIIGRNIEYVYVEKIIDDLSKQGYKTVSANYIPSKKNGQVADFYEKAGLNYIESKDGNKFYFLDFKELNLRQIDYIKVVSNLK